METLQNKYNTFRSEILSLLWRQWTALGVAGQSEPSTSLIDPEALLLCSLSLGRYDARLFDEIIDWLYVNGEFINVQRLAALQDTYMFSSGPQISAIAEYLSHNKEYQLKWQRVSKRYSGDVEQPLFYTVQGKPLPVGENKDEIFLSKGFIRNPLKTRKLSRTLSAQGVPSLLLRLRALIGVSARCELLCILEGEDEISPAEAARLATYNRKTTQNALKEMSASGYVEYRAYGREKLYRINKNIIHTLIPDNAKWICWAPFYKGLELLWNGYATESDDPLILSAQYRRIANDTQPYFGEAKTGIFLTEPSRTPGADYLSVYQEDLARITEGFNRMM